MKKAIAVTLLALLTGCVSEEELQAERDAQATARAAEQAENRARATRARSR